MKIDIQIVEQPNVVVQVTESTIDLNVTSPVISLEIQQGGVSSLSSIPDVVFSALSDGDLLSYDGIDDVWRNAPPAANIGNIDGGTFF